MDAATFRLLGALFALVFPVLSACGGDDETTGSPDPGKEPMNKSVEVPAEMFLAAAPSGAIGVREALTTAKAGEEIVVRAVIGGRKKPFVDGRAVLVVADAELTPCGAGEGCLTPWDYCCETKETLLANTLTVQIVDSSGSPLAMSLDGVDGLGTLKTIVVAGAVRSAAGSLVIDAKKIYVADG